jgi:hypothetical protein
MRFRESRRQRSASTEDSSPFNSDKASYVILPIYSSSHLDLPWSNNINQVPSSVISISAMSIASEERPLLQQPPTSTTQLWKLPIKDRPPHGTLFSRLFALPTFLLGCITILTVQTWFYPAWVLMKVFGERSWFGSVFEWGVGRTKQMFGMLRELIT